MMLHNDAPNIAMMGGGTGSFTLLQELKNQTPNITALVNMCDDGGSSGTLRDELGVLPPGDVRQCLVALSNTPNMRGMFSHRFGGEGRFKGHPIGNLILAGLEEYHGGDFVEAVKTASTFLNITGKVVPISVDNHTLVMQDGPDTIRSEYVIGHRAIQNRNAHLTLEPAATINPDAEAAIYAADLVAIAPGNLYGSLLPILAVKGVPETLRDSGALMVMVANLVTKPNQTNGWHVVDYVHEFERYLGKDAIDIVLYNSQLPSGELLSRYAEEGEYPVGIEPERFGEVGAVAIGDDLVAGEIFRPNLGDTQLRRTLIRHAAGKVGQHLMWLCEQRTVVTSKQQTIG